MKFNPSTTWFKESEEFEEDELDIVEEELNEGLYVDPANYGNYDDLVDVVDKEGNPQKMTRDTYDNNKDSGEFKQAEPKEQDKKEEPVKKVVKPATAKAKELLKDAQIKSIHDIVFRAYKPKDIMDGLFGQTRRKRPTLGLTEEDIKEGFSEALRLNDEELSKVLNKALKKHKELGLDKEPSMTDSMHVIGDTGEFERTYGYKSTDAINLMPENFEETLSRISDPEKAKYNLYNLEDYANKGKNYTSIERAIEGFHDLQAIDDETYELLKTNLEQLSTVSANSLEGARQAKDKEDKENQDSWNQKIADNDKERKDFRDKEYKGTDSVKKALDRVLNPVETLSTYDGIQDYVDLQKRISDAVKKERSSGRPGSQASVVNHLRGQQYKVAEEIVKNLENASKEDVQSFFDQYFEKSGLPEKHRNNFAYQVGITKTSDGKTFAEKYGLKESDFAENFGGPYLD